MESTQVVIIGAGATGAGILWDLTLRGISATLLEQGDIANGATGRCHGLLHSGGRYAVKDTATARDCLRENLILKATAPHCIEDIGGLSVLYPHDDPAFFDKWHRAADTAGIPTRRLSAAETFALEPALPANILGAFTCPDAHVDVFRLVLANLQAAAARGAHHRTYSQVTGLQIANNRVRAVHFTNTRTGEHHQLACQIVINAAGGWAQSVAALAGLDLPIRCDKGSLLVLNHRLTSRVINRCRQPGDGDILVPAGPVSILGTSSIHVPGPEKLTASLAEVDALLELGAELVPSIAETRILRVFSGVRALHIPRNQDSSSGRSLSRGFALFDHEATDNLGGFLSITGGKLTTYRLMAAQVADCVAAKLGVSVPCTTDTVPLRPAIPRRLHRRASQLLPPPVAERLARRLGSQLAPVLASIEARPELAELVCECELVTRAELEFVLGPANPLPAQTIADIGRRTRLGFGPCQGTFCGYKAMLAAYQTHRWSASQAADEFSSFLHERIKGQSFVHQGQQLAQLSLCSDLYGIDLPGAPLPEANPPAGAHHDK